MSATAPLLSLSEKAMWQKWSEQIYVPPKLSKLWKPTKIVAMHISVQSNPLCEQFQLSYFCRKQEPRINCDPLLDSLIFTFCVSKVKLDKRLERIVDKLLFDTRKSSTVNVLAHKDLARNGTVLVKFCFKPSCKVPCSFSSITLSNIAIVESTQEDKDIRIQYLIQHSIMNFMFLTLIL